MTQDTAGEPQALHDDDNDNDDHGSDGRVEFESRMSDSDALMWNIEKDPMLRSTITTVIFLDGRVSHDELRAATDRMSRAVPRLRQRVVRVARDPT